MINIGLHKLTGLRVDSVHGFEIDKRKTKYIEPKYILFDDKKTYIELEEQDYYTYHDCSTSARHVNVMVNKEVWLSIHNNVDGLYPIANTDI